MQRRAITSLFQKVATVHSPFPGGSQIASAAALPAALPNEPYSVSVHVTEPNRTLWVSTTRHSLRKLLLFSVSVVLAPTILSLYVSLSLSHLTPTHALSPTFSLLQHPEMDTFRARDIKYELTTSHKPLPSTLEGVKFGTVFTDHMFLAEYDTTKGWSRPIIKPFGPLHIHPAAQVLHYGLACFEGMKAYYGADGHTRLFRPEMNMHRLHRSANRLELADFDPKELLESLKALLRVDRAWLPSQQGNSIYIRPFMFSNADVLGVSRSTKTTLSILLSPVGPYFPGGLKPIRLFVDETRRRAWPGGVGQFKVAGNYAPTIKPQVEAAQKYGASQVVYTFSNTVSNSNPEAETSPDPDSATFAECGAMNVFFFIEKPTNNSTTNSSTTGTMKRELVTPPLDGTILPGITRDSILQLAREWGEFEVSERQVTVGEVRQAAFEGRLLEVFGSGTACIVQPVGELVREGGEIMKTTGGRSLAERFQGELTDIQYGRKAHHWSIPV